MRYILREKFKWEHLYWVLDLDEQPLQERSNLPLWFPDGSFLGVQLVKRKLIWEISDFWEKSEKKTFDCGEKRGIKKGNLDFWSCLWMARKIGPVNGFWIFGQGGLNSLRSLKDSNFLGTGKGIYNSKGQKEGQETCHLRRKPSLGDTYRGRY